MKHNLPLGVIMKRSILNRETFFFMALLFFIISNRVSGQSGELLCDFEGFPLDSIKKNDALISFHNDGSDTKLDITFGVDSLLPKVEIKDELIGSQIWNLSNYVYVTAEVKNLDNENSIEVFGYFNDHKRGNGILVLGPGETGTLQIPITRDTDNLEDSIKTFLQKEFAGLPGGYTKGFTPKPKDIHSVTIHAVKLDKSHSIRIDNIKAETLYTTNLIDTNSMYHFIDEFGQYRHMPSQFKTNSVEEMVNHESIEQIDLNEHPGPMDWNEYGGWESGPQFNAKGYFYVEKINNKWWLIDPMGKLFWSNGINDVGVSQSTYLAEGENNYSKYFEKEPSEVTILVNNGKFVHKMAYFYESNLKSKYSLMNSENWEADVATKIHKRLRSWGINTLGNWSNWRLCYQKQTPYVVHIKSGYKPIDPTKVDTVKNPDAWQKIRDAISNQFDLHSYSFNDSFCIGYFIDNEIWFEQFSDSQYRNYVIDRYYAMCDSVKHEKAPNKLNLGSRLHFYNKFENHEAAQIDAMAKYCDVISINRYSYMMRDLPALKDINPEWDKPLIIGEFHFASRDHGFSWTGLKAAKDQMQKGELYQLYINECLDHENIIGAHWFCYTDQMFSTRYDTENGEIGWVDVCDKPHNELIEAAREVNYNMYEKRYGSCGEYQIWDSNQEWSTYELGDIRVDEARIWECINKGFSYIKPSSPSGHFGWNEIGVCGN